MKSKKDLFSLLLVLVLILIVPLCVVGEGQKESEHAGEVFPKEGKTIRLILTHGVGGSLDTAARGILPYLEKYLGSRIVPENMLGAGGRRAMEHVFATEPNGYTIIASGFPSRLIGELLYPESKFVMKEFVHLGSWVGGNFRSIVVAKDAEYQDFEALMAASKMETLKGAGGGGLGSTSQLQIVFLKEKVGLDVDFIPYDSTPEVANAVIGNHVHFGVMPLDSALRFRQQGDVKIIAVHATERVKIAADVPTLEELGYKGVEIGFGVGAYAPPGTPQAIQDKYAQAIEAAVNDPDFQAWAESSKIILEPMGPEKFYQTTLDDYENIYGVLDLLKIVK